MVKPRRRRKKRPVEPAKKPTRSDVSTWLDRIDAAKLARVTTNTIINWQTRGLLHPMRVAKLDNRGAERLHWVYDPKELVTMRTGHVRLARTPGETAALAFEAFDHGKTVRQIVIDLHETPEKICILREEWLACGGADRVMYPMVWEELEKLVGPFKSMADLIDAVAKLVPPKPETPREK